MYKYKLFKTKTTTLLVYFQYAFIPIIHINYVKSKPNMN